MCQSTSGAQTISVNESNYIVEAEKSNGKEFSRKIVYLGKKFKNKLNEVKDSIPKEVYIPFFTAFGAGLTYKVLKDGINYYYFDEKNKIPRDAIESENTASLEVNNTSGILNEENKTSKSVIQTEDKKKIKSETSKNSSEITQNEENKNNNFSQTKEKEKKGQSIVKRKGPSRNCEAFKDMLLENGINTFRDSNKAIRSNDTKVKTEKLEKDLMPVFLGNYSDPLIYLLVSLTPKKWGLQKAWHNLWHFRTEDSRVVTILKLILSILSLVNFSLNLIDFVTSIRKISFIERFSYKDIDKRRAHYLGELLCKEIWDYLIGRDENCEESLAERLSHLDREFWLFHQLVSLSPVAERLYGFRYIYMINRDKDYNPDLSCIFKYNNSVAFNIKCSLINIFIGKAVLYNYVHHKGEEARQQSRLKLAAKLNLNAEDLYSGEDDLD